MAWIVAFGGEVVGGGKIKQVFPGRQAAVACMVWVDDVPVLGAAVMGLAEVFVDPFAKVVVAFVFPVDVETHESAHACFVSHVAEVAAYEFVFNERIYLVIGARTQNETAE